MPWVAFTRDWLWRPPAFHGHVATQFKSGMVKLVTRAAAAKATAEQAVRAATEAEIADARRR